MPIARRRPIWGEGLDGDSTSITTIKPRPLSCKSHTHYNNKFIHVISLSESISFHTMKLITLALAILVSWQVAIAKFTEQVLSVDSYGAIANDSSVQAAVKNSQAISQASVPSCPSA